jgi:hypothetical protein
MTSEYKYKERKIVLSWHIAINDWCAYFYDTADEGMKAGWSDTEIGAIKELFELEGLDLNDSNGISQLTKIYKP